MKRSEIIRIIRDAVSDFNAKDELDEGYILSKLEEAGMQPPAIKEPCETFVLYNGQYVKTEDSFIFTHKWDEE